MAFENTASRRPWNVQRRWKAATRKLRELGSIASALLDTAHPYMAHIVPMRRCNLACTYCNEFDDLSEPVPIEEMERRIDELGRLGTSVITISGGEPLLHPELDRIIARIRSTGAIAGMITNGYLLMPDRIERLNRAGLDHMQISIDNVMPDAVSKKSLKVLDAKLRMLAEHADFHVNINSVVGGGIANPTDALTVSERALALGFSSTIGIIHDGSGQLKPLGEAERDGLGQGAAADAPKLLPLQPFSGGDRQRPAQRLAMPRRRALSLYLRVRAGALLLAAARIPRRAPAEYGKADVEREFLTEKSCAPNCTISCVHQVSYIDHWRAPQTSQITPGGAHGASPGADAGWCRFADPRNASVSAGGAQNSISAFATRGGPISL